MKADRHKTLQELEGEDWGEPEWQSGVVTECHRLRRVPLCELTVENIRLLLGQTVGLEHLIPLALEKLRLDALAEGDLDPGDLLVFALRLPAKFLRAHPEWRLELRQIAEQAFLKLNDIESEERAWSERPLREAFDLFEREVVSG